MTFIAIKCLLRLMLNILQKGQAWYMWQAGGRWGLVVQPASQDLDVEVMQNPLRKSALLHLLRALLQERLPLKSQRAGLHKGRPHLRPCTSAYS